MEMKPARIFLLTSAAMIAFAANSLLCRLALRQTPIDPTSFTFVRLATGALALWLITRIRRSPSTNAGSWPSALALFVYAAAFSFAYLGLSAGTGALLLFGAVQATMIFWGWHLGERFGWRQMVGLALAIFGLVSLVLPGVTAPPLDRSLLMLSAGAAWGIYSLRGQGVRDPVATTAGNFLRAVPIAALLALPFFRWLHFDSLGAGYAAISGALTSGLGYVLWYAALPNLKAASAATVQLSVPVLAAAGGILLLGEPLTVRFFLASSAVLGGIALVVLGRSAAPRLAASAR